MTFFERPPGPTQGTRHGGFTYADPGRRRPRRTVFGQRGIRGRLDLGQQGGLGLPAYAAWATRARRGTECPGLLATTAPAFDRAFPDAKKAGRLSLRESGVNGSQQPLAEVGGVLLHALTFAPAHLFRNAL